MNDAPVLQGGPAMDCDDHDYQATYCERCGGFTGEVCIFCGEWYDGGDHLASRDDLWCNCEGTEDEDKNMQIYVAAVNNDSTIRSMFENKYGYKPDGSFSFRAHVTNRDSNVPNEYTYYCAYLDLRPTAQQVIDNMNTSISWMAFDISATLLEVQE